MRQAWCTPWLCWHIEQAEALGPGGGEHVPHNLVDGLHVLRLDDEHVVALRDLLELQCHASCAEEVVASQQLFELVGVERVISPDLMR